MSQSVATCEALREKRASWRRPSWFRPCLTPHYWVEIRDANKRTLVCAIEILSPFNKRGRGRLDYLRKRQALLTSPAHLMEIDLLRQGQRVPMRRKLPAADYFVFLSRAGRRPLTEIWPITLAERLPIVPVPLLGSDPDAALNLQNALDELYDGLRYDLEIDYQQPPDVPLSKLQANWANRILRKVARGR